jgi:hypothetical protein
MGKIEITMPCGKELDLRLYNGRENGNFPIGVCGTMCNEIPAYGFGSSSRDAVRRILEMIRRQCNSCPKYVEGDAIPSKEGATESH